MVKDKLLIGQPKNQQPAAKVRTGCHTCKIRHVKCGEEKPICTRCAKAGIVCDGYGLKSTRKTPKTKNGYRIPVILSDYISKPEVPIITQLFGNEIEFQYFNLFCTYTGHEILPLLDPESIRYTLLQQFQVNPAIRHAIIAIGALDKTAESVKEFRELSLDNFHRIPKPNKHHNMAIHHYARAIEYMRFLDSSLESDMRSRLLICLLVVCFEAWNGNHKFAFQQANTGIAIICEWRLKYRTQSQTNDPISSVSANIEDEIVYFFGRLAMQISILACDQAVNFRQILQFSGEKSDHKMPENFENLREAMKYYHEIIRRSVHMTAPYNYLRPQSTDYSLPSVTEQRILEHDIRHWLRAFNLDSRNLLPHELRLAKHLKIHQLISLTAVIGIFSNDHIIWDKFNAQWDEIIGLSGELMNTHSLATKSRPTNFSFDSRLIIPLWLVGLRCRDPVKRRKVVDLMSARPRREGLWDSMFTSKVLEWVMELEESFLVNSHIPGWARIENLVWDNSEFQHRRSFLSCQQRASLGSEFVTKTRLIMW